MGTNHNYLHSEGQVDSLKEQQAYRVWSKAMALGARTGCHQKPERSLFIRGFQFPVCSRCLGVYIGYLAAVPLYFWLGFQRLLIPALAGCNSMLFDWLHQAFSGKESNHVRRILTGIAGGFGLMVLYMRLIGEVIRFFKRIRNNRL